MATSTRDQVETLRALILQLQHKSVAVRAVDAVDEEGPNGSGVVVTVQLSSDSSEPWNRTDFLSIRRKARDIAVTVLGNTQDVRLVYESYGPSTDETTNLPGEKLTEEEVD